jgi:hypothetical protein
MRINRFTLKTLSLFLILLTTLITPVSSNKTLEFLERDTKTKGDWLEPEYGECGYALPFAETLEKQNAMGPRTGIGDTTHEHWWRTPWSIEGPMDYPYEDYIGGIQIPRYRIHGPMGPPRPLVNATGDCYRPTFYNHSSYINLTITDVPGDYNVSVYMLDWEMPVDNVNVKVSSSNDSDDVDLGQIFPNNFAGGRYAVFQVESNGTIIIEISENNAGSTASLAGVFLDSIGPVTGVEFLEIDESTMGNWRPRYGNDGYLLAGFNAPTGNTVPVDQSYDETDLTNYIVSSGVGQYAADPAQCYGNYPFIGQYAAYAWGVYDADTDSDGRLPVYPVDKYHPGYPPSPLNGRRFGAWDCGEFLGDLNYFTIELEIPIGSYYLSLYIIDYDNASRSQTVEIWDSTMATQMATQMDTQYINGTEINEGLYLRYLVRGKTTLNIKVIADPGNINSFIDALFINCIPAVGGELTPFTSGYRFRVMAAATVPILIVAMAFRGYRKRLEY